MHVSLDGSRSDQSATTTSEVIWKIKQLQQKKLSSKVITQQREHEREEFFWKSIDENMQLQTESENKIKFINMNWEMINNE